MFRSPEFASSLFGGSQVGKIFCYLASHHPLCEQQKIDFKVIFYASETKPQLFCPFVGVFVSIFGDSEVKENDHFSKQNKMTFGAANIFSAILSLEL